MMNYHSHEALSIFSKLLRIRSAQKHQTIHIKYMWAVYAWFIPVWHSPYCLE